MNSKMSPVMNFSADAGKHTVIPLKFAQSYHYPVCFTRDLFHINNQTLMEAIGAKAGSGAQKTLVFMDDGLINPSSGLFDRIYLWFEHYKDIFHLVQEPVVFPGGEGVKNSWDHVHRTTRIMNDSGMDRHGLILALGGGAMLDMIGF